MVDIFECAIPDISECCSNSERFQNNARKWVAKQNTLFMFMYQLSGNYLSTVF
jgi:hypothetical protein